MFELVHMVWDIYDRPRSGIADFDSHPHYFQCVLDEKEGGYSDIFAVTPIDNDLLGLAQEQWAIYRAWERKFHSGLVDQSTHPGHGGQSARYDELEKAIAEKLEALPAPTLRVLATFRQKEEQPDLPKGCLLDLEVCWRRI